MNKKIKVGNVDININTSVENIYILYFWFLLFV